MVTSSVNPSQVTGEVRRLDSSSRHCPTLPASSFYHRLPRLCAEFASIVALLLIDAQILCSFEGKYFYYLTGVLLI